MDLLLNSHIKKPINYKSTSTKRTEMENSFFFDRKQKHVKKETVPKNATLVCGEKLWV